MNIQRKINVAIMRQSVYRSILYFLNSRGYLSICSLSEMNKFLEKVLLFIKISKDSKTKNSLMIYISI